MFLLSFFYEQEMFGNYQQGIMLQGTGSHIIYLKNAGDLTRSSKSGAQQGRRGKEMVAQSICHKDCLFTQGIQFGNIL